MEERYIRNLGALTEEECAVLRGKTVFVAGCGGLGGYLIEMLLRLGVGEIRAADGDAFEASNLNRQLLSSPSALGQSKAEAAAMRAELVNPDVRWKQGASIWRTLRIWNWKAFSDLHMEEQIPMIVPAKPRTQGPRCSVCFA